MNFIIPQQLQICWKTVTVCSSIWLKLLRLLNAFPREENISPWMAAICKINMWIRTWVSSSCILEIAHRQPKGSVRGAQQSFSLRTIAHRQPKGLVRGAQQSSSLRTTVCLPPGRIPFCLRTQSKLLRTDVIVMVKNALRRRKVESKLTEETLDKKFFSN